jgi:lipoate-protein ligase A
MRLLDLTLPMPAENLALDQALLDAAEAGDLAEEVLRLWEPRAPFVVVGRSSKIEQEVNAARCAELQVPILRRASGGAAIVTGPGCLMYGVLLSYERHPELRMLDRAHHFVLARLAARLQALGLAVEHCGTSDLALQSRKFSGNSLRCKRDHFLYHGTLLYDFELPLIDSLLLSPPRQPEYREGRSHLDFVCNLPLDVMRLREAVVQAFEASLPLAWPLLASH